MKCENCINYITNVGECLEHHEMTLDPLQGYYCPDWIYKGDE